MRILILTAPIGGGHGSTAKGLASMLASQHPTAAITIRSLVSEHRQMRRLPALYTSLTNRAPWIWGAYYYARRVPLIRRANGTLVRLALRRSISTLDSPDFDLIFITHPMYCNNLSELNAISKSVIVTVADLYGGPLEWFTAGASKYVIPSHELAETRSSRKLNSDTVVVRRLPTFIACHRSGIAWSPGARARVLLMGGNQGSGPLISVARGLSAAAAPLEVTLVCGYNRSLLARAKRDLDADVTVLGYLPDLPQHLSDYDLIITKPGSTSIRECLDAGVPIILMPGIPGIERPNIRFLATEHSVPVIRGAQSALQTIERLINVNLSLSSDGRDWLEGLSRIKSRLPDAGLSLEDVWQENGP